MYPYQPAIRQIYYTTPNQPFTSSLQPQTQYISSQYAPQYTKQYTPISNTQWHQNPESSIQQPKYASYVSNAPTILQQVKILKQNKILQTGLSLEQVKQEISNQQQISNNQKV